MKRKLLIAIACTVLSVGVPVTATASELHTAAEAEISDSAEGTDISEPDAAEPSSSASTDGLSEENVEECVTQQMDYAPEQEGQEPSVVPETAQNIPTEDIQSEQEEQDGIPQDEDEVIPATKEGILPEPSSTTPENASGAENGPAPAIEEEIEAQVVASPEEYTPTTESPSKLSTVSVASFGAKGSDKKDDTSAIQKAIDSVKGTGGIVYIPKGTYYLSSPLILPSFVTVQGEARSSVTLMASKSMESLVKTESYDSLMKTQTGKWNDTSGVPMTYALSDMTFDGKNLSGNGISMYGYDFQLRNLLIKGQTGNGIVENWGKGTSDTWNDNYSKFFESYADGIEISGCNIGILWNSLTDAYLTGLNIHDCVTGLQINAPIYIDTADLHDNGTGIVLNSDAQVSNLTVSNCDVGVKITGWQTDIDYVKATNNTKTDIEITKDSKNAIIRSAEIKTNNGHAPIVNKGNAIIGRLTLNGKTTYSDAVSTTARTNETKYFKSLVKGLPLAKVGNGQTVVDVMKFGAKGDLTHDDTAAIQNAIDSLKTSGGTVHLKPGTYRITKTLILHSGITLAGDGTHATIIFLGDKSNCTMLEAGADAAHYAIRNIEFNGNKWNSHNINSIGLILRGSEFVIDNVWVNGTSGDGVRVNTQDAETYSVIKNLNIKYCGKKGIVYGTSGKVYSNALTVSECGSTALETNVPAVFGFVHLYANHGTYQMVENGGIKGEKIVSESSYGMASTFKKKSARIGTLQLYNNRGTDIYLTNNAKNVLFGTVMIKNPAIERASYVDISKTAKYGLRINTRDAGYSVKTMGIDGIAKSYEYTGNSIKPIPTITYSGKKLKSGTDYSVSYVQNKAIGNGAVVIVSKGTNKGAFVIPFEITEPKIKDYSGTYYIAAASNTNLVIDIYGGSKDSGANVQLYNANKSGAQKFIFSKTSDGYYTILNAQSGKSLDIYGGSAASGTNVWQYNANGSDAQKWLIIENADGSVTIKSKLGTVLDIYNGSIKSGTNIWAYRGNGSAAQKWKLMAI